MEKIPIFDYLGFAVELDVEAGLFRAPDLNLASSSLYGIKGSIEALILDPLTEEKKVKKLIPFTDEFDWCEEGVLVMVQDIGERYAVRAKGDKVWTVDDGKKLCEIENAFQLTTQKRSDCQKVIHEVHRPLTKREFAEFIQDHKGMVKDTRDSVINCNLMFYDCEKENEAVSNELYFRFRGSEEWHPATTELYEIAKELNA